MTDNLSTPAEVRCFAEAALRPDERLLLLGITGSRAYKLNTPTSDIDFAGIYTAPTDRVLSLGWNQMKQTRGSNRADMQIHEIGKWLTLALSQNPTVMEFLWLDEYLVRSELVQSLIENRQRLLGADGIRKAYGGYAHQQATRLVRRMQEANAVGDRGAEQFRPPGFSADLRKRTRKHGRHCWRLTIQCRELLANHRVKVDVSDHRQEIFDAGTRAELDPFGYLEQVEATIDALDRMPTRLPSQPDRDWANRWLVAFRKANL